MGMFSLNIHVLFARNSGCRYNLKSTLPLRTSSLQLRCVRPANCSLWRLHPLLGSSLSHLQCLKIDPAWPRAARACSVCSSHYCSPVGVLGKFLLLCNGWLRGGEGRLGECLTYFSIQFQPLIIYQLVVTCHVMIHHFGNF